MVVNVSQWLADATAAKLTAAMEMTRRPFAAMARRRLCPPALPSVLFV
jgi:hypothetical protein